MDLIIGFSVLISPVLLTLMVHIFRDICGKSRNKQGLCYSCAAPFFSNGFFIVHHRSGEAYAYCKRCRDRHELWKGIILCVMGLCIAATLALISISSFDANPQKSFIMAAIGLVLVLLIIFIAIRHISLRR